MTTQAPSSPPPKAEVRTLAILLAGFLEREVEERQYRYDRNSAVLCLWPLGPLGPDEDPRRPA